MTEQEAQTIVGAASKLSGQIIGSLPAQFLMLCVLNLMFIFGLLWFMNQRELQRERLIGAYLSSCEKQLPVEALDKLLEHLQRQSK